MELKKLSSAGGQEEDSSAGFKNAAVEEDTYTTQSPVHSPHLSILPAIPILSKLENEFHRPMDWDSGKFSSLVGKKVAFLSFRESLAIREARFYLQESWINKLEIFLLELFCFLI